MTLRNFPTHFHFSIGGYFSGRFEAVMKGDALHFYVSDYPIPMDERSKTYVAPLQDDSDWHALVRFLSAMKWKRRYSSVAMDGLQWELTYEIDGKKKSHYGSNEFPTDFDDFTALLRLIADKQGVPEGIL